MFLNRQFLSVILELRLCFDLKYVLILKIGQTWIKLKAEWSTVLRLRCFEILSASNHTKVRWKYISKSLPISFFSFKIFTNHFIMVLLILMLCNEEARLTMSFLSFCWNLKKKFHTKDTFVVLQSNLVIRNASIVNDIAKVNHLSCPICHLTF